MTVNPDRDCSALLPQPARAGLAGAVLVGTYDAPWPTVRRIARRRHLFVSSPKVIA